MSHVDWVLIFATRSLQRFPWTAIRIAAARPELRKALEHRVLDKWTMSRQTLDTIASSEDGVTFLLEHDLPARPAARGSPAAYQRCERAQPMDDKLELEAAARNGNVRLVRFLLAKLNTPPTTDRGAFEHRFGISADAAGAFLGGDHRDHHIDTRNAVVSLAQSPRTGVDEFVDFFEEVKNTIVGMGMLETLAECPRHIADALYERGSIGASFRKWTSFATTEDYLGNNITNLMSSKSLGILAAAFPDRDFTDPGYLLVREDCPNLCKVAFRIGFVEFLQTLMDRIGAPHFPQQILQQYDTLWTHERSLGAMLSRSDTSPRSNCFTMIDSFRWAFEKGAMTIHSIHTFLVNLPPGAYLSPDLVHALGAFVATIDKTDFRVERVYQAIAERADHVVLDQFFRATEYAHRDIALSCVLKTALTHRDPSLLRFCVDLWDESCESTKRYLRTSINLDLTPEHVNLIRRNVARGTL